MHIRELGLNRGGMYTGTMHNGLDGFGNPFEGFLVCNEDMQRSDHLDIGQLPDMKIMDGDHIRDGFDFFTNLFNLDTDGNTLHQDK